MEGNKVLEQLGLARDMSKSAVTLEFFTAELWQLPECPQIPYISFGVKMSTLAILLL